MKKVICILSAIVFMISQAVLSYADDINPVYAPESIQNDMKTNMYDDSSAYNFLFGTKNVRFDFNSAIPVYSDKYDKETEYSSFSEMIFFTERYAVPVYNSKSNEFLGLARFGKIAPYDELPQVLKDDEYYADLSLHHAGEWELKSFTNTTYYENLLYQIENNNAPADKVYYVEILYLNRYGLLYVSSNENGELTENFLDVSKADSNDGESSVYISGEELLREFDYKEEHTNGDEVTGYSSLAFDDELEEDTDEPIDYKKEELEEDTSENNIPNEDPAEEGSNLSAPVEAVSNPPTGNNGLEAIAFVIFSASICLLYSHKKAK